MWASELIPDYPISFRRVSSKPVDIDIGETSVGKYLPPRRKPPPQTWQTFLENHVKNIVSKWFWPRPRKHSTTHLRQMPLLERKRRLRKLVPPQPFSVLYTEHEDGRGTDLFEAACSRPGRHCGEMEARSLRGRRSRHELGQDQERCLFPITGTA